MRAILRVAAPLLQNSTRSIALFSCRSAATLDGMRWIASRANCARDIQTSSMCRIAPHRLFRTQGVGQGRQTDPMRRQPGRSKAVRSLSELFPHARRSRRRRCDKPTPASPATRVSNRTSIPSTRNENQPRPISRARLMKAGGSCASVMTTAAIPASPPIVRRCSACSIASANDVSMWSSSTRSTAFGVDRPPKVDHSAVDFQIDLVEMPSRVRLHATLS